MGAASRIAVSRTSSILVAFGVLGVLCGHARAAVVIPTVYPAFGSAVEGLAVGGCTTYPCFFDLSQPTAATGSTTGFNSSASAFASLGSGYVSASASANTEAALPNGAASQAAIWDTVIFSGAKAGDMATLTISGTANVSAPSSAIGVTARANAFAILMPESASPGVGYFLAGNGSTPEYGAYTLSDQVQIANGVPYLLLVSVNASTGLSGGAEGYYTGGSASIDDPWHLDVPLDVKMTFASTSAVPEPSTWAMMLLGFAGLVVIANRRKPKPATMAA
jgi:PEP-CTERM motif-containing protein